MKSKSISLDIPTPCHEKWQSMHPVNDGRFCQSCQKIVLDFTGKSDREIALFFQENQGNACGRFRTEQLRKPLRVEQPARFGFGLRALGLLVPGLLAGSLAKGQAVDTVEITARPVTTQTRITTGMVAAHSPQKTEQAQRWKLAGTVQDENGELLIGATIQIQGTTEGTITDIDGIFSLQIPQKSAVLVVSYTGYHFQEIAVNGSETCLKVVMQEGSELVGELVVGVLGIRRDETLWSLARHEFQALKTKIRRQKKLKNAACSAYQTPAEVESAPAPPPAAEPAPASVPDSFLATIFPNPFDGILTVEMTVPKTETLHLRLLDLNGQVVFSQKTESKAGRQQAVLNLSGAGLPDGNYVLEISGEGGLRFAEVVSRVAKK